MTTNPLALSDEDFINQPLPETEGASSVVEAPKTNENNNTEGVEPKVEEKKTEEVVVKEEAPKPLSPAEQAVANIQADPDKDKKDGTSSSSGSEPKVETPVANANADADKAPAKQDEGTEAKDSKTEAAPNYEELYKKMMAPFVANGKKIELQNPEELIQLAQMGANYTRKLQEIAPQRKILTMLGNHNLLDESKLSFLIALDKKDPEAIKKLIMDSGIDPLDIDTKIKPAYQEGSYEVSDEEVNFRTHLEEVTSTEAGKQMLLDVEKSWDQASKDMLWQHPEVMSILRDQREAGIYAKITTELDRQKTLGKIAPTVPFLEAYKIVGDQLQADGKLNDPAKDKEEVITDTGTAPSAQQPAANPTIVTTRALTPKPTVDNGDKVAGAAPTRSTPGNAQEAVNFFAMSDDDFLKASNLQGRI